MLEFILGKAGTGKTRACLNDMVRELKRDPLGKPLVLLLPEHMTYKIERELAELTEGQGGFVRAYVFGFRRFARQVLLETGGMALPRLTDIGRRMMLGKILGKRRDELKIFGRAAKARGFGNSLAKAIDELKNYALTPEALTLTAATITNPELKAKLVDLSLLAGDFAAAMEGKLTDGADMLNTLAKRLPEAKFMEGAEVWVDGFIFFNPQERRILSALMDICPKMHITLAMDSEPDHRDNRRAMGLFHRSWETMQTLQSLAAERKIPVTLRKLTEQRRFKTSALQAVEKELTSFVPRQSEDSRGVVIVESANQRLEAETVAADILRLCREEGYSYRDIGILIRDEAYVELTARTFAAYNIPFFQASKRGGFHHPLAELIRSLWEILASWRYEPIFRALRTGFFPATEDQIDRLENYVLEFGVRGKKHWLGEQAWSWERRSLTEDTENVKDQTKLDEINAIRRQVMAALSGLASKISGRMSVRQMTTALYEFLQEIKVPETLAKWEKRDIQAERLAEAAEHRQIWGDILELLDQLVETGGDEVLSRDEYEGILTEGLEALEISLVPPGLDYVSISPFDQNSLDNSRAIYIMGVNEGTMPRRAREKGLFTDAERLRLREAGLDISSGGLEGILAEKYLLYRGFTNAREYMCVSYALADGEGDGLAPSSLVTSLRKILPTAEFLSVPLETMNPDGDFDRLSELNLAYAPVTISKMTTAFRACREGKTFATWWQDAYNWSLKQDNLTIKRRMALGGLLNKPHPGKLPEELAGCLFARRNKLRGSVTQFERFRRCPFQHFAQHGLRLQERYIRRFQALDLGNLLHGVLQEFGLSLKKQGRRWQEVAPKEMQEMCQNIIRALAPRLQNDLLLSSAQYRHQLTRIEVLAQRSIERLIAWDKVSKFHPEVYEYSFGRGDMPPLIYKLSRGAQLEIVGQIDRLDFDENRRYFLVVDYKTGEAAINLLQVYYGIKLQLLTYLLAAKNFLQTEAEDRLPAGMLYFFLRYPFVSADSRMSPEQVRAKAWQELKMPGWVLLDIDVIKSIDPAGQFTKLRLTKTGGLNATDRPRAKTAEEFQYLLDYVGILLADTGEKIMRGEITPYPVKQNSPCTYCPYDALCGFDPQIDGYAYREHAKLDNDVMMERIKKICDKHKTTQQTQ